MAELMNFNETDGETGEHLVIEFAHAPYLNEFDDGYDPNEDPDFEDPTGFDAFEYGTFKMISSNGDDIYEEFLHHIDFELADDAFDDTRVCFRGKDRRGISLGQSLGPCDHICCKIWHLEPLHPSKPGDLVLSKNTCKSIRALNTKVNHMIGCTDKECNNPHATGILIKASLLARASKIFNSHTTAKLKSIANASKLRIQKTSI